MIEYSQEELATEVWRKIDGYPFYEISDIGRARSIDRNILRKDGRTQFQKGVMLKLLWAKGDYWRLRLYSDPQKWHQYSVHRLVATAFIPNPLSLPEVNHKDTDKTNNRVSNLEWCSHAQNMAHAGKAGVMRGLQGSRNPWSKLCEADVLTIRTQTELSVKALALKFSVSPKTIINVIDRSCWNKI